MSKKNIDIRSFELLYDNVLLKGIALDEKKGIYKPAQYDDKPELGEVVSVGEGRIFDNGAIVKLRVKKGDIIYFNKYSHTKFNFDGDDYYIIREEDIVGFLRK